MLLTLSRKLHYIFSPCNKTRHDVGKYVGTKEPITTVWAPWCYMQAFVGCVHFVICSAAILLTLGSTAACTKPWLHTCCGCSSLGGLIGFALCHYSILPQMIYCIIGIFTAKGGMATAESAENGISDSALPGWPMNRNCLVVTCASHSHSKDTVRALLYVHCSHKAMCTHSHRVTNGFSHRACAVTFYWFVITHHDLHSSFYLTPSLTCMHKWKGKQKQESPKGFITFKFVSFQTIPDIIEVQIALCSPVAQNQLWSVVSKRYCIDCRKTVVACWVVRCLSAYILRFNYLDIV